MRGVRQDEEGHGVLILHGVGDQVGLRQGVPLLQGQHDRGVQLLVVRSAHQLSSPSAGVPRPMLGPRPCRPSLLALLEEQKRRPSLLALLEEQKRRPM